VLDENGIAYATRRSQEIRSTMRLAGLEIPTVTSIGTWSASDE
jgi:hypothetical protein